jgi:hypothetical protein
MPACIESGVLLDEREASQLAVPGCSGHSSTRRVAHDEMLFIVFRYAGAPDVRRQTLGSQSTVEQSPPMPWLLKSPLFVALKLSARQSSPAVSGLRNEESCSERRE